MGFQGSCSLVWQQTEEESRKDHNPPGEETCCLKNAHRGSWRRSTCGRSCLKAGLAGGEDLTLVTFRAQASVELWQRGRNSNNNNKKPQTSSEGFRKGKENLANWGNDSSGNPFLQLQPVQVATKPQASGFSVNLCPKSWTPVDVPS
ncbi:hypothetical protein STEG23_025863 [Scotinomys teguina]